MQYTDRRFKGKSRAALLWGLAFLAAGQAALGLFLYRRHPEMCDPDFNFRLRALHARLAEKPGRPLALFVGSSRAANGFCPREIQGPAASDPDRPVAFNFALLGSGPVREWMMLRRVLASGVRPKWIFIEVWAPFLPQTGFYNEEHLIFECDLQWVDVPLTSRLYRRRWDALSKVIEETLAPAVHNRVYLMNRYAHFLLPRLPLPHLAVGNLGWGSLDESGWLPVTFSRQPPDDFRRRLEDSKSLTKPILDNFRITPVSDRALRELLNECRDRGIQAALVIMPEHSAMRPWYPPATLAALHEYLVRLRDEYGVPVIDSRSWAADDDFLDFCHLLPDGARRFSRRFGRDVFQPFVAGRPLDRDVLLGDKPDVGEPPGLPRRSSD